MPRRRVQCLPEQLEQAMLAEDGGHVTHWLRTRSLSQLGEDANDDARQPVLSQLVLDRQAAENPSFGDGGDGEAYGEDDEEVGPRPCADGLVDAGPRLLPSGVSRMVVIWFPQWPRWVAMEALATSAGRQEWAAYLLTALYMGK
eukprot:CAMPEP_0113240446 /NCGR_PEP_ID=MMETSP0008_2-20120614/6267_1 /TAXON_ID=97485 /ORGANISM="Prymnesium parvum" /LENGTH=143 /DNA_ID=CAMNT_0000087787 /DNA_START=104 /DNA_END=533 /DNA_ORIENTATION=+ /assembly_acc=CAM_ASM_000153